MAWLEGARTGGRFQLSDHGAQRDLSVAELDVVTAMTVFQKARVKLDRTTARLWNIMEC